MLDVQFISDFIEKVRNTFDVDPNTFATIVITISIFIIGYILNFIADLIKSHVERKNTKRIFRIAIEKHIRDIRKQERAFDKTLDSLTFENRSNFKFVYHVMASKDLFWNFGFQKTYEAYFSGPGNLFRCKKIKKLSAFNNIWNSIESNSYWHKQFESRHDEFIMHYNLSNEKRNDAIDGYRKYLQEVNSVLEGKTIENELSQYLIRVLKIHSDWTRLQDRTSPPICHRNLVLKNRILYKKFYMIGQAFKINDYFLDATTHYIDQVNRIKNERQQIDIYRKLFKYNAKLLEVCLLRINTSRWMDIMRFGISWKNKIYRNIKKIKIQHFKKLL